MPTRPSQPASYPGGRVLIEVIGAAADSVADPVSLAVIDQTNGAEKATHLDPRTPATPWKTAAFWFSPANVNRAGGRLSFDFEHGVSFHLRPNAPYLLRLRDASGGFIEERLIWKAFRGKSSPPDWQPPTEAAWPQSTAAPEPPPPTAPPPEPVVATPEVPELPTLTAPGPFVDPRPDKGKPRFHWIYAVISVVILLGGGMGWWWRQYYQQLAPVAVAVAPAAESPATKPAPAPLTLQNARDLVKRQASVDEALAEGQRFLDAGQPDGAFLLFRYAGEKGSAKAALAVGAMYDPELYSPKSSPLPAANANNAADWYRKAAEAGDAEAQYRLGRLLAGGKTGDPRGAENARPWYEKAAVQGHSQARAALGK